ncbi:MAG: FlgD immunoglobulin-like domain containing protein, partial [bacterium]|nr:FlgD immunoglobulin-like domain containing protein [bacterium]
VNGCTDDWLYGDQTTKNKIYAFTPEVGSVSESISYSGFFPDTLYIEKQILENLGPMLFLAYAAGEAPIIEHTPMKDIESEGPYPMTVKIKPPIVLTTPVPLDTASYKVFYNNTGTAPFDSLFLQATGNADEYFVELPGIPFAEKIYYFLSASDQSGRTGLLPRGAPLAAFSFHVGQDIIEPNIVHTPINFGSIYADGFVINAIVTDNVEVGAVFLKYCKNGGELDSLEMTKTITLDEYQGIIIPTDPKAGDYYEYQIIAYDISQNRNRAQLPDSGFFKFYLKNSLFYDFEWDSSFTTAITGDWQWGTPTSGPNSAHSGSKLWATNLSGNYSDLTSSVLETPEISLANKDSAKLVFWHWYLNEYSNRKLWDGGNVKISVDGWAFQVIEPVNGYDGIVDPFNIFLGNEPCFGGPPSNGNFWRQEVFDLTPYVNHNIKIRFHFGSDQAVNEPGWYIDDVEIMFEELTVVAEDDLSDYAPKKFELVQNYPNPFNPQTRIQYQLARPAEVRLEIFNLLGKKVITLVNEKQPAGIHSTSWDGRDATGNQAASGVYFYRLLVKDKGNNHSFTRKMVKLQ